MEVWIWLVVWHPDSHPFDTPKGGSRYIYMIYNYICISYILDIFPFGFSFPFLFHSFSMYLKFLFANHKNTKIVGDRGPPPKSIMISPVFVTGVYLMFRYGAMG